jgi:Asp-tRNA(Asn)/Glu-tRNA(Gln) amidotransferase A subunit family amidase
MIATSAVLSAAAQIARRRWANTSLPAGSMLAASVLGLSNDADAVTDPRTLMRAAGAVILGKSVTTELATYAPGKTRNPHNPA